MEGGRTVEGVRCGERSSVHRERDQCGIIRERRAGGDKKGRGVGKKKPRQRWDKKKETEIRN